MGFDVRLAGHEDIPAIVALHEIAFQGYFLSNLGREFLTLFYTEFIGQTASKIIVAKEGSHLAGFVVGTVNANQFYSHFYQRHFLQLGFIVVKRFFTSPGVRRDIYARLAHVRLAFMSILRKNAQAPSQSTASGQSQVTCRLLSIAVHPESRGRGVAGKLSQSLMDQFKQHGVKRIGLSVHADNATAIKSYKNNGWIIEKSSVNLIYFYHDII